MKSNAVTKGLALCLAVAVMSSTPSPQIQQDPPVTPVYRNNRGLVPGRGDLYAFLDKMGNAESGGQYDIVGGYNKKYLGKYQFSLKTIKAMGVDVSPDEFLKDSTLQDSVMIIYLRDNARSLRTIIAKFEGTVYQGVRITKSGILAGAHLIGAGGIRAYFEPERYSYPVSDGNGVHVSVYMKKFADYDLTHL
jgi:hypothetical protein